MIYCDFGKTGLKVSKLALGTVSLGCDYGINAPNGYGKPDEKNAIRLIETAFDEGINFYDTAPAYGESEEVVGKALSRKDNAVIATKINVYNEKEIIASVENSLRLLKRECLDILQIHNATVDMVKKGEVKETLLKLKKAGKVKILGASIYTEAEALAVIEDGSFQVLQVPFNILDQKMKTKVFPLAEQKGVGILVRSVYLKGAISNKANFLPESLSELKDAVVKIKEELGVSFDALPEVALRYGLSACNGSILVGVRTIEELKLAIKTAEQKPYLPDFIKQAEKFSLSAKNHLVNPALWVGV